jgi:hypothetical protein
LACAQETALGTPRAHFDNLEIVARKPHIELVREPLSDEKIWRVVVTFDDARGGDWYGPLETLAEAKARLKEESVWSRQVQWIEDANGTRLAPEESG